MLRRLVYSSRASKPMQDQDFVRLLEISRKNNQANHITGLLVYADGDFLQVLEGEADVVQVLFAIIAEDNRHQHCRILSDTPTEERVFNEWNMGFTVTNKPELLTTPGFVDFFNPDFTPKSLISPATAAQFLLLGFRAIQLENN